MLWINNPNTFGIHLFMAKPSKCCCILCGKELTNLGLPGHINIVHKGNTSFKDAGNASRRGVTPWNKGLSVNTDIRVREQNKKALNTQMRKHPSERKFKMDDAARAKIALAKRKLYDSGWQPICGRTKKYEYISKIAGSIKVDGNWELLVCKYLDSLNVTWSRNLKRFPYIAPNGKYSTYQPDFYIADWDTYLEVKGYQTEKDNCKWSQFPHKIIVWKRDKIKSIESELNWI